MLVLSTLSGLLSQLVSPSLHTAILLTPQGHLVAYACNPSPAEERVRIVVGLSSEVWREGIDGDEDEEAPYSETSPRTESGSLGESAGDDEVGLLECEV